MDEEERELEEAERLLALNEKLSLCPASLSTTHPIDQSAASGLSACRMSCLTSSEWYLHVANPEVDGTLREGCGNTSSGSTRSE